MDYKPVKNLVLRKIDRSEYIEDLKYARGCTANRVYPVSIATGTQDGDIYVDGKAFRCWSYMVVLETKSLWMRVLHMVWMH